MCFVMCMFLFFSFIMLVLQIKLLRFERTHCFLFSFFGSNNQLYSLIKGLHPLFKLRLSAPHRFDFFQQGLSLSINLLFLYLDQMKEWFCVLYFACICWQQWDSVPPVVSVTSRWRFSLDSSEPQTSDQTFSPCLAAAPGFLSARPPSRLSSPLWCPPPWSAAAAWRCYKRSVEILSTITM